MYRVLSKTFTLKVYLHLVHIINKQVELLLEKSGLMLALALLLFILDIDLNGVIASPISAADSRSIATAC